jgi:hypothetical protein
MKAKTPREVKTWAWRVVEASGVFMSANWEEDGRWAQGAGLAKSRPETHGKCLSLLAALADPAADEHGGTEKEGMARRVVPFAIFSSAIFSSTLFKVPAWGLSGSRAAHRNEPPANWRATLRLGGGLQAS